MKREIKFRAFYTRICTMDYNPYGDEFICEGTPINQLFTDEALDIMNYILMQYVGLKDKKGKDIFEGDILSHSGYLFGIKEVFIHNVVYCIDNASFICEGETRQYLWEMLRDNQCEVIGNIYENPELLS